jgi:hypothetical protein
MHQTFYIDIDEEITSIVDRIRHAQATEIIIVVPKRALLIQSIVNLRILKKESDEAGLQLMIVTQDKLGKILIEKAGIFVQQKMDNISDEEIDLKEEDENNPKAVGEAEQLLEREKGSNRLDKIGSTNYFDESAKKETIRPIQNKMKKTGSGQSEDTKEVLINKELVLGIGSDIRKKSPQIETEAVSQPKFAVKEPKASREKSSPIRKIDSFFYEKNNSPHFPPKTENLKREKAKDYNLSVNVHKGFWFFGIISASVIFLILGYLFLPKANVQLIVKTNDKSVNAAVTGDVKASALDYEKNIIPAKIISADQEVVKSLNATGSKSVSNQKARGMLTIYNGYDSNPQPLVATTRLMSESGKLFRLVKGVTVPGVANNQPGSVEAEVAADQSGEDYNIGPEKFTIPGFLNSGNEKYSKFYAQSKDKMTGGGNGTDSAKFITAEDIASARSKVSGELNSAIKQKIKGIAGDEAIVLDDAISEEEAVYKLSNSAGDVASSFQITAQTKASAIVVKKKDLDDMAAQILSKSGNGQISLDKGSVKLDLEKPNVDLGQGTIDIKFHASGKLNPNLDLDTIKNEILGKNDDDLKAYLNTFPDIEKVEVNYWPSFMTSRIPFRAKQVSITLDKI